jgi:Spy/CpxP family protein refolding chaperone
MSKVKSLLCILALTFFLTGSLAAQDTTQSGQGQTEEQMGGQAQNENPQKELATDLQAKINLTEEQTQQVQDILTEYQNSAASTEEGTSTDAETNANDKIASLLDDMQKASFESVKSDWWSEVKEKLAEVPPQSDDQMKKDESIDRNSEGTGTDSDQGTQSDTTSY